MDRNFQWVIQAQFTICSYYWDNTSYEVFGPLSAAMGQKNGRWGSIDKSGERIHPASLTSDKNIV